MGLPLCVMFISLGQAPMLPQEKIAGTVPVNINVLLIFRSNVMLQKTKTRAWLLSVVLMVCTTNILLFSQENNKEEVLFNSSFVKLWELQLPGSHDKYDTDWIFSHGNKYLFGSSNGFQATDTNTIYKFDAKTGKLLKIYPHFYKWELVNFQVSKKYNYLISYGNGLKIMNIDSDSILYEFKGINDRDRIRNVLISENDSLMFFNRSLFSEGVDNIADSIYVMRLSDLKMIKIIGDRRDNQLTNTVSLLGFSNDLKYLYIYSRDRWDFFPSMILKYDVEKDSIIDSLNIQVGDRILTKKGKLFISQPDNKLLWIDCNSKEKMTKNYITDSSWILQFYIYNMRIDGKEKYLFVGTNKGTERIYSVETLELLLEREKQYFADYNIVQEISSDNSMIIEAQYPKLICYSMNPDSILSSIQTTNFQTKINIQNDNLIINDSEFIGQQLKCELSDINGKMIEQFDIAITKERAEYLLPIQNLPNGLYLLNIRTNNFNQTFKILKDN